MCDWLYPLMATDSPVLLCNTGVYMFPDMMAPTPGSYVGVVLSSELPQKERELFQTLLSQMTDLRVQVSCPSVPCSPTLNAPGAAEESEQVWQIDFACRLLVLCCLNVNSSVWYWLCLYGIYLKRFLYCNRLASRIYMVIL